MSKIKIILLLLLFLTGCSTKNQVIKDNHNFETKIKPFEETKTNTPPIVLPTPYKKISPLDNQYITFSAKNAPLSSFLYSIAKVTNLNLVIDKDVDINQQITLNLNNAPVKEALDIIMNITGYYYEIKGNILYIKKYMTKIFKIPYIKTNSSYNSDLGGDVLSNTGGNNQNIKGNFSLKFNNPKEANDFYNNLENNLKNLISQNGTFTINKFTGTLIVTDTKENIKKIERFLNQIKKSTNKNILIEAKILEITLNKSHQLGINWNKIFRNFADGTLQLTQTLPLQNGFAGSMSYSTDTFNMLIQALSTTGRIQTISNPRIRVLNGQSALILSGDIIPFWEKKVEYTTINNGNSSSVIPQVTYERRDVLQGVSLGVTPIITDNNTILLNIVPVSTSIENIVFFKDNNNQVVASAPKLNIKEVGTVIKAKNNNLIIIGGLISNQKTKNIAKVPFFSDIPIIGNLFKRVETSTAKKELVILLRLRIINE